MRGINKSLPAWYADNVNLNVRPHPIHALMGENGAGKSTLLKCLSVFTKRFLAALYFRKEVDFHSGERSAGDVGFRWRHREQTRIKRSVMITCGWDGYPTKAYVCRPKINVPDNKSDI